MALPVVAIIGRPNVGKSSLLNALAGRRISIVEPTAGVTRDRVSTIIEKNDRYFELVDTGGFGIVDATQLSAHIQDQIQQAIASASLVVFMVDIRDGLVPLDQQIAQLLRKHNVAVTGVANKADTSSLFPAAGEFQRLGFGPFLPISTANNLNKNVLLDIILENISHLESEKPPTPLMKIAVVGKRNAGKSTLVNSIVGYERVIVSEIPGTTRDSIDIRFRYGDQDIIIIDTAGLRKKSSLADSIDFYSYVRATASVRRADVVLFLLDSTEPVSQVDKKLAALVADEYKACVLVVNKWDLAKDSAATGDYQEYLNKLLPNLRYAPIAFTTATEGQNVQPVLDLASQLFSQATATIQTSKLNEALEQIKMRHSPGAKRTGPVPKIYYATQIAVNPVTILMFVNKSELFDENFRRFIVGQLRELLAIPEVPVRLLARSHKDRRPKT